jgi:hypothetical protein
VYITGIGCFQHYLENLLRAIAIPMSFKKNRTFGPF